MTNKTGLILNVIQLCYETMLHNHVLKYMFKKTDWNVYL